MDVSFDLNGTTFVWNRNKAHSNLAKHEVACEKSGEDMINEKLKKRLKKDRPMTSITLRVPEDVVESLKEMAPELGFSGYQPLISDVNYSGRSPTIKMAGGWLCLYSPWSRPRRA